MSTVNQIARTYNSFSGVDIRATFGGIVIGELAANSYSITREKVPIYTMGDPEPKSFSRGKRGIAGTVIFTMFDRHALVETFKDRHFFADKSALKYDYTAGSTSTVAASLKRGSEIAGTAALTGHAAVEAGLGDAGVAGGDHEAASPWYVDKIPPFDIVLSAANEYGAMAVMMIFGIEILNEGYGVSIDDVVSEQQMTYVARSVMPWKWVARSSGVM